MKTLYMETTKKEPEETLAEIQVLLKNFKLKRMQTVYDNDGQIAGLQFTVMINENEMPFKMPVDYRPILKLAENGKTKYAKSENQARRVAWRQILKWIEAQLALVELNMVSIEQVFLPYMMINDSQTVFDKYVESDGFKLLEA